MSCDGLRNCSKRVRTSVALLHSTIQQSCRKRAKMVLGFNRNFSTTNKLWKIFNRNTIKTSMDDMHRIMRKHNHKVMNNSDTTAHSLSNCGFRNNGLLEGKGTTKNVVYQATANTRCKFDVAYIGTTEKHWKQRFYNNKSSFQNKIYTYSTTLSKYIRDRKMLINLETNVYNMWLKSCRLVEKLLISWGGVLVV